MTGRRRKSSDLEKSIVDAWDAIVFPDGQYRTGRSTQEEELLSVEWDGILAMAYKETGWLVGSDTAYMVCRSRWNNAIVLNEVERACDEIARCLEHPEPFDRQTSAEIVIRLHMPRLVSSGSPEAAKALEAHIDCGAYAPSKMAWWIAHMIWPMPNQQYPTVPVSDEVRSLLKALATARKASKRNIQAAEQAQTWPEFFETIECIPNM